MTFEEETTRSIQDIRNTLYGNGQPGMDEVLRDTQRTLNNLSIRFDTHLAELKKEEDQKKKNAFTTRITIISILVTNIVAFVAFLVGIAFKLYPLLTQLQQIADSAIK